MNVFEIPTRFDIPHYTQQTELAGKTYTLEFELIERENFWMLHLSDQDGNPLVCGIKLVPDWPLLRRDAVVEKIAIVLCTESVTSSPNLWEYLCGLRLTVRF